MRLFITVDLNDEIRRLLGRLTRDLAERIGAAGARVRIKWVRPEALHFTLRFIGEVDVGQAAGIKAVLQPALNMSVFDLQVTGLGIFPPAGAPRVIWVGAGRGAADLTRLNEQVEARLCDTGLAREKRPFAAHLTVGRTAQADNRSCELLRGVVAGVEFDAGFLCVDHVTLYESQLRPEGPVYTALTTTALKV